MNFFDAKMKQLRYVFGKHLQWVKYKIKHFDKDLKQRYITQLYNCGEIYLKLKSYTHSWNWNRYKALDFQYLCLKFWKCKITQNLILVFYSLCIHFSLETSIILYAFYFKNSVFSYITIRSFFILPPIFFLNQAINIQYKKI